MFAAAVARKLVPVLALAVPGSAVASDAGPALTGDITAVISGAETDSGQIGCALFAAPDGFPLDASRATTVWLDVQRGGAECRFEGLTSGWYAVAVSHDLNGNRKTDTNFLGIPEEAWGVSNNVRPTFRAPRFEEAAFQLAEGGAVRLEVRLAR
ncbi:MAG: DUF2141 domain-containing protein [Alphaproteobacteria bacterium]|nr:DUF2141 domain-containing protein [Alphaproteobacteria bacterium]